MSKYKKYMIDKRIENSLSDEERQNRIYGVNQMAGLNEMDGYITSLEDKEFVMHCELNDVPIKEMLRIFWAEYESDELSEEDLAPRYHRAD